MFYQNFLSLFTKHRDKFVHKNREQKSDEKPQWNVCYRPGDESRTLDLEEWRDRRRSAVSLFASLVRVACLLPEVPHGFGALDKAMSERKFAGKDVRDPLKMGACIGSGDVAAHVLLLNWA